MRTSLFRTHSAGDIGLELLTVTVFVVHAFLAATRFFYNADGAKCASLNVLPVCNRQSRARREPPVANRRHAANPRASSFCSQQVSLGGVLLFELGQQS